VLQQERVRTKLSSRIKIKLDFFLIISPSPEKKPPIYSPSPLRSISTESQQIDRINSPDFVRDQEAISSTDILHGA
jgi:hypothetical protein